MIHDSIDDICLILAGFAANLGALVLSLTWIEFVMATKKFESFGHNLTRTKTFLRGYMLVLCLLLLTAGVAAVATDAIILFYVTAVLLLLSMLFTSVVFNLGARKMVALYTRSSDSRRRHAQDTIRIVRSAMGEECGEPAASVPTVEASTEVGTTGRTDVSDLDDVDEAEASDTRDELALSDGEASVEGAEHAAADSESSHARSTVNTAAVATITPPTTTAIGQMIEGAASAPASGAAKAERAAPIHETPERRATAGMAANAPAELTLAKPVERKVTYEASMPRTRSPSRPPDPSCASVHERDIVVQADMVGQAKLELQVAERMKRKAALFMVTSRYIVATIVFAVIAAPIWVCVSTLKLSAQLEWVLAFCALSAWSMW
eukprot:CAMPEP_0183381128 /NCGR_PEP_ID=MMETSP0164_2-20130417/126284_1 /TAXON_ID=221442 /ORGANISM="Coccolithus pelagicus ssp braarudi, Strain PLY182g" /LENGTH=378 /DNA_ID=CAMNT_0025558733 /DNA_START=559 /DNA_END=1692 /DNA_ORIENTATION=-